MIYIYMCVCVSGCVRVKTPPATGDPRLVQLARMVDQGGSEDSGDHFLGEFSYRKTRGEVQIYG